jgi:hypothetical protein
VTSESNHPEQISIPDARGGKVAYTRAREYIAVHATPSAMPDGAAALLEDGSIGVFNADASHLGKARTGPVYQPAGQSGLATLAVPTGRVLVRFQSGASAASRSTDIAQAGYRIEETLAHAPNAAWVRAADGSIATALRSMERLESLSQIERVEPQLIRSAARR